MLLPTADAGIVDFETDNIFYFSPSTGNTVIRRFGVPLGARAYIFHSDQNYPYVKLQVRDGQGRRLANFTCQDCFDSSFYELPISPAPDYYLIAYYSDPLPDDDAVTITITPVLNLPTLVAATSSTIYYSKDEGANWTQVSDLDFSEIKDLIYVNGPTPQTSYFIAVGKGTDNKAALVYSPDGIIWTPQSLPINLGVGTFVTSSSFEKIASNPSGSLLLLMKMTGSEDRMGEPYAINATFIVDVADVLSPTATSKRVEIKDVSNPSSPTVGPVWVTSGGGYWVVGKTSGSVTTFYKYAGGEWTNGVVVGGVPDTWKTYTWDVTLDAWNPVMASCFGGLLLGVGTGTEKARGVFINETALSGPPSIAVTPETIGSSSRWYFAGYAVNQTGTRAMRVDYDGDSGEPTNINYSSNGTTWTASTQTDPSDNRFHMDFAVCGWDNDFYLAGKYRDAALNPKNGYAKSSDGGANIGPLIEIPTPVRYIAYKPPLP